ncbi:McrC family protein [Paenibacillus sp. S-38]|uniref:McrC family protein n=1 Tax=Paenibacillus sp. S-38 TaxID=3416710 RepID=UPI003CF2145A
MRHFVVTECLDCLPITSNEEKAFTAADADELDRYVGINQLEQDQISITRQGVTFINYVGFIQLTSCSIEILPKVSGDDPVKSRRVLLHMLNKSRFLDIHESQTSQLVTENMNLIEIIGYLLVNKLSKELARGSFRTYQSEQAVVQRVRGKIDMASQLKRSAVKQAGVSCIYDEFEVNNPLNQVFKAAIQYLMMATANTEIRKLARHCLVILEQVSSVPVHSTMLNRIAFDRTNRRFESSFQLARLILSCSAPTAALGHTRSSSILFKMNELFEAYVAYLVRKLAPHAIEKDRRYKLLIKEGNGRGVFQLEPDIYVPISNGQAMLLDTKWKILRSGYSRHGVKREDFYQMYAYLTRYKEVGTVVLLYPYHSGIEGGSGEYLESWHLEDQPDKKLKLYALRYDDEEQAERELRAILKDEE